MECTALRTNTLRFSRDGRRLAYVAGYETDARPRAYGYGLQAPTMMFLDGQPGRPWQEVIADTSTFSPDGNHTLYWVVKSAHLYVPALDDSELSNPGTDRTGALVFSADSKHVVYSEGIRGAGTMHVVTDSVAGPECDFVGIPRVGADGRHVAYRARRSQRETVVVDGVFGREFDHVGEPALDASGAHEAHFAWLPSGHAFAMVDGRQGPEFDWVAPNGPAFLPDGRLQYLAVRNSTLMRVTHILRGGK